MRVHTTIELAGKTGTGLQVHDDIVTNLGSGKRPAVRIAVGGHAYQRTVATMGGRFMVPLTAEHRAAAGVAAGDQVEVDIQLDTAPREVLVPPDLGEELASDSTAQDFFETLVLYPSEGVGALGRGGQEVRDPPHTDRQDDGGPQRRQTHPLNGQPGKINTEDALSAERSATGTLASRLTRASRLSRRLPSNTRKLGTPRSEC